MLYNALLSENLGIEHYEKPTQTIKLSIGTSSTPESEWRYRADVG